MVPFFIPTKIFENSSLKAEKFGVSENSKIISEWYLFLFLNFGTRAHKEPYEVETSFLVHQSD
jgi:hypothetical protein